MNRIQFLDNLRALATLLLIPYHSARIYDWPQYFVKDGAYSSFEIFTRFIDVWFMPLFFLIAGIAAKSSLNMRRTNLYLRERLVRLLVPLTIGIGLFMPINGYFAFQYHASVSLNFIEYLPNFLTVKSLAGFEGNFSVGHLWFLIYLMVFSMITPFAQKLVASYRITKSLTKPSATLKFFLIFAATLCLSRATGLPYPNPLYFAVFYFAGFTVADSQTVQEKLLASWKPLVAFGFVSMYGVLYMRLDSEGAISGNFWYENLRAINALVCVLAILGIGKSLLSQPVIWLQRLNTKGIWIYVAHVPIISAVGYTLIQTLENPIIAWLSITAVAFLMTLLVASIALRIEEASWKKRVI